MPRDRARPRARTSIAATALLATLALVLTGCVGAPGASTAESSTGLSDGRGVLPASTVDPILAKLPRTGSAVEARVVDGRALPTNRWYSGLAFGDSPQPVFPLPISFRLHDDGFSMGVPVPTASADLVAAPAVDDLRIRIAGASSPQVIRDDGVSVTVAFRTGSRQLAEVTIARGSPTVTLTARTAVSAVSSVPIRTEDGVALAVGTARYAVTGSGVTTASGAVTVPARASALITALPSGASAAKVAAAAGGVTRVDTEYGVTGGRAVTRLAYRAVDGSSTLFAATPQQASALRGVRCDLGGYDTIDGRMRLCSGTALTWSVPALSPAASLDLDVLSAAQRSTLLDQLGRDAVGAPVFGSDTYFGGKKLARLATLVALARQLGSEGKATAARLQTELADELETWAQLSGCAERKERCFAYDAHVGGVVGQAASFGSDEFNDHHFHYGYFLYAAAIAAQDDSALRDRLAPLMTVIAADIASGRSSSELPARRVFDAYSGHSWASGFSPFADGNNQESSSEAVNAWNGLALWARVAGDAKLLTEARWMLSSEAAAAKSLSLGVDTSAAPYSDGAGYDHRVVGIVWDGKRDYATWFSPAASSKLGIQLLPLPPVRGALDTDPELIRATVQEAGGADAPTFPDYLLMYSALAGKADAAAALTAAEELPDSALDDGNSRSQLYAWIMVAEARSR